MNHVCKVERIKHKSFKTDISTINGTAVLLVSADKTNRELVCPQWLSHCMSVHDLKNGATIVLASESNG
jgi:hypothetical protein